MRIEKQALMCILYVVTMRPTETNGARPEIGANPSTHSAGGRTLRPQLTSGADPTAEERKMYMLGG